MSQATVAVQDVSVGGGGRLLFATSGGHLIRAVSLPGAGTTTLLGNGVPASVDGFGTGASFNGPRGLALDGAGALFISEWTGHRIRRAVLGTLAVSTLAGSGTAGFLDGLGTGARFNSPLNLLVLSPGLLLVSDFSNGRVRALTAQLCPPGYYCNSGTPPGGLPCPPGSYGAPPGGLTTPQCSGPCTSPPGGGCPWGSRHFVAGRCM